MNGTGPFRLKENRGQAGYSFVANDTYWGGKPSIDAVEFTVLDDNARVAALRGGQIDIAVQIDYAGARQLQSGQVLAIGTSNHRYLNMNVKKAPFKDPRVREAIALALNRPALASGLWGKYAQVGNDNPMWSGYPFTDKTLPQRKQDLAKAKSLLQAANATNLKLTLTCYRAFEMPAYAQRVASDLKKIGIDCKVKIYTSAQYFDGVSFGAKGKLDGGDADFVVGYDGRAFVKDLKRANKVTMSLEKGECHASFVYVAVSDRQVVIGPVSCL